MELELKIDSEFSSYIPTSHDNGELRARIAAEGCLFPLIVWKGQGILIDGYRRLTICQELGLGYKTRELEFADRAAAKRWMDSNAIATRTLTPDQHALIIGRLYNGMKKTVGHPENQLRQNGAIAPGDDETNQHSGQLRQNGAIATAEKIAEQTGLRARTIQHHAEYAAAVETVKAIDPDIEAKIATGEAPPRKTVIKAAKAKTKKEAKAILAGDTEKPPTPKTYVNPFDEFNEQLDGLVVKVRALAREVQTVLGVKKDGTRTIKWTECMSYEGTVGKLLQVAHDLVEDRPGELSDGRHGFKPARDIKLHKQVQKARQAT